MTTILTVIKRMEFYIHVNARMPVKGKTYHPFQGVSQGSGSKMGS